MTEIIINKEKHECAPAVAEYVKELDRYNKALLSDIAKKLEEIAELKAENARLEESFQRATGEIAADPLPGECRNKAKPIDDFICSQCEINLVDLAFVEKEEYEDGYKDEVRYVYEPKFCPECGRKVKKEVDDNA